MVQLAGGATAVQLTVMALEEAAVAVSPVGAEGAAAHAAASVVALACTEAPDEPSASTASTMKKYVVEAASPVLENVVPLVTVPTRLLEDGVKPLVVLLYTL